MYGTLRGALAGRKVEYDRESYKDAIPITWSATLKAGDQVLSLREEGSDASAA